MPIPVLITTNLGKLSKAKAKLATRKMLATSMQLMFLLTERVVLSIL